MAMAIVLRVRLNWLAKHTLFKPLIGPLFIRWGGVPVRRHESGNRVELIADAIESSDSMVLLVPVEGTRGRTAHWKSGFYHIARRANVPIVLGFLDYGNRVGGFGPSLVPTEDVSADMDVMRAFYASRRGLYPELESPVRLEEERDS